MLDILEESPDPKYFLSDEAAVRIMTFDPRQQVVRVAEGTKKGYAEARAGQSINLAFPNSTSRRGRVADVAHTLDTGMRQYRLIRQAGTRGGMKVCRLTPMECERLQGFPDGWTDAASDAQRYKCCGNAVTVNVVQAVMERLLESLSPQSLASPKKTS